jgi:WD40 repeat protein
MGRKKLKSLFVIFISLFTLVPFLSLGSKSAFAREYVFPEFGSTKDLITPLNSAPTIYDGASGQEDGHHVLYTTSKGVPAMFNVIDLEENKLLRSLPLEGAADSWQHEVAPDGTVYITAGKYIWGYSPVTKKVEALATIPESSLWALAVDENSNAYIGTFPGGKVFQYNKSTKELRDYGKMIGEISQEYVRSMDYHDGYLYVGTAHDKIFKLNVKTGEKVEIAEELHEEGFVYDLDVVDGRYVFARYSSSKNMYIYDIQEESWLDVKLSNVTGLHVTDSLNNKVYFVADGTLKYVDLTNLQVGATSMKYGSSLRGADWVEIKGDSRLPGKSLVTVTFDGRVVFFNIETETVVTYDSVIPPTANVINQIHAYSEDKIYISGMAGGTGAVYNPLTGNNNNISLGQADSIYTFQDKVYFGTYPSGSVHVLDPKVDPYAAPKTLFTIGNEQDRLHTMTGGDGKLFIGSIATYQRLGGALTVYDGETYKVFRNVVQDQSINGLAYKDGLLYGSTTIKGGLGSVPTAEQAKVFIWDPKTEKKIKEVNLEIEGLNKPAHIGKLTVGPDDGYIWGGSSGYVFALDPETLKVVKSVQVEENPYPFEWDNVDFEWSNDGLLYALVGVGLYAINPETLEFKFVTNAVSFDLGEDGNIYFSKLENRSILAKIEVIEEGEYVWASVPVENPSFENDMDGWTSMFGTGNDYSYAISTEMSYSGEKSLKVFDNVRNNSVAIYSGHIPVTPGKEYMGEVMMYIKSGTPSLLVRMYDKNGKQLNEQSVQVRSGYGEWQKVQQKIIAPDGAVFARLFALSTSYALTDGYFDDFAFYERVKASDVLKDVQLEVDDTTLTRGQSSTFKVTGTLGSGEKVELPNATIVSSDESVVALENDTLVAYNKGQSTVKAEVEWKGKTIVSNEVVVTVELTLDSFTAYVEKLHQDTIIPQALYMKLSNYIRIVKHFKEDEKPVQHLYDKMEHQIEKWDAGEHSDVKKALLADIEALR